MKKKYRKIKNLDFSDEQKKHIQDFLKACLEKSSVDEDNNLWLEVKYLKHTFERYFPLKSYTRNRVEKEV